MVIREARLTDVSGIAKVGVDTWRATYRGILADEYLDKLSYERSEIIWRDRLREISTFTIVAEDEENQIVGYAFSGPERNDCPDYPAEIYALYVLPTRQKSGIGRQLVLETVRQFIDCGANSMVIWALAQNQARGFYESIGGRLHKSKVISIGGVTAEEVAYVWDNLRQLTKIISTSSSTT